MNYLILGGTGTLGQELARKLLLNPRTERVTIFSRCELKQKQMQSDFGHHPLLHFRVGDIRDKESLLSACRKIDVVFHVAALKHVDVLEENPEESVKTNILGTMNVAEAAIKCGVQFVVFSSTDKAVDPINVYGMSKGISEKILLRQNEIQNETTFLVYRWGNVIGSRGSVVGRFVEDLKKFNRVYLTSLEMTRFWIRIEDAVEFMLSTYSQHPGNEVMIPEIKSATLPQVVRVLAKITGVDHYSMQVVGVRRGEKLHEALRSEHDYDPLNSETSDAYSDEELEAIFKDTVKGLEKVA